MIPPPHRPFPEQQSRLPGREGGFLLALRLDYSLSAEPSVVSASSVSLFFFSSFARFFAYFL